MNNLYVFAIGGSGERVMKSLVMMLAAGMPIGAKRLCPVFVDNDVDSNALNTCLDLINYYRSNPKVDQTDKVGLHELCNNGDATKVPSFAHVQIAKPVILNVAGSQIGNLDRIIGKLDPNKEFEDAVIEERNLLFTQDDLDMPLTVGFVGNPNIGSVVLNSLSLQSDAFNTIYSDASTGDGVFVVGSLFGGTGAAGFPLIINKFRSEDNTHCPLLGGVAVLPYFGIKVGDQAHGLIDTTRFDVNSDTFTSKTRAALMYYDEYMRDMDYMYYVGDNGKRSLYEHYVGGKKQENPYNIIEVMAAMSVVNFSNKPTDAPRSQVAYEIPLWDFDNETLSNTTSIRNKALQRALVKFQMMKELFENKEFIEWSIVQKHLFVENIGFTEVMRKAVLEKASLSQYPKAWGLHNIFKQWDKWITELSSNRVKRQMHLFNKDGVTRENITQKFFADSKFGAAKTTQVREGHIFNRRTVTQALLPEIEDALNKSFKDAKINSGLISQEASLSLLLYIISNALDKVIDEKCNL